MTDWDVIIVGAGPAGSAAALGAVGAGARTLIVERADLPRYKRCGGGLTGAAVRALRDLPGSFTTPTVDDVGTVTMSRALRADRTRTAEPFVAMVRRADLDAALAQHAQDAGVTLRTGAAVREAMDDVHKITLRLDDGTTLTAGAVVAADGAHSRLARLVGPTFAQVDFALETEVLATPELAQRWRGHLHLDVGTVPGGYGWLFPKGDVLTVGVIARDDAVSSTDLRAYLDAYVNHLGLAHLPHQHAGGHHTRTRTTDSPLHAGRIVLAGDAAGWVDPWMREGISYALRSGRWAGSAAALLARGEDPKPALDACRAELQPELDAGTALLAMMRRSPWAVHAAVTRSSQGWRAMQRIAGGDASLQRALAHPVARRAVAALR